jgi:hypothetical protein
MRTLILALPVLLACGTAPAGPERPPIEPLSSGVTLYVLDTWQDFLEDGMDLSSPIEPSSTIHWMGEQALQIALRAASRLRGTMMIRRQHEVLRECEPLEFLPDRPLYYFEPGDEGRLRVRQHHELSGFRIRLTGEIFQERYLRMEFDFRYRHARDVEYEVGEPVLREDVVARSSCLLPIGASLLFTAPREGGRAYVVIVHVASVEPRRR